MISENVDGFGSVTTPAKGVGSSGVAECPKSTTFSIVLPQEEKTKNFLFTGHWFKLHLRILKLKNSASGISHVNIHQAYLVSLFINQSQHSGYGSSANCFRETG